MPQDAYNLTACHQNKGVMVRVSQAFAKGSQVSGLNRNGITNALPLIDNSKVMDTSSSLALDLRFNLKGEPLLAFNVNNLTSQKQRSHFQCSNQQRGLHAVRAGPQRLPGPAPEVLSTSVRMS